MLRLPFAAAVAGLVLLGSIWAAPEPAGSAGTVASRAGGASDVVFYGPFDAAEPGATQAAESAGDTIVAFENWHAGETWISIYNKSTSSTPFHR